MDYLITEADLARLCRLSARRIRQLAEEGIIHKTGNKYDLGETFPKLLDHYRKGENEIKDPLKAAQLRKLQADADLKELEYAEAKKLVAPIEHFEQLQSFTMTTLRQNVMNVPQRVVLTLLGETNEIAFKTKLRAELVAALTKTANTDLRQAFDEEFEINE